MEMPLAQRQQTQVVIINLKGLENGSYTVEFETPSGYTPTKANSGRDITVDSTV